jgi:glutathione S-transferase
MGIKVHGGPLSPAVLRVFTTLYEKEQDGEFVPVNLAGGDHKKEPFLSLNPFGQVPGFEDGDLIIFESRAICQYIAQAYEKEGNKLTFPEDAKKNAFVNIWTEVESQKFDPLAYSLLYEIVVKPIFGWPTDEEVAAEKEKKLPEVLDVYEARLKQSKYLAGEIFTLADLYHLPALNYLVGSKVKYLFDERPHVSAWATEILARPSWQKVLALQKKLLNN